MDFIKSVGLVRFSHVSLLRIFVFSRIRLPTAPRFDGSFDLVQGIVLSKHENPDERCETFRGVRYRYPSPHCKNVCLESSRENINKTVLYSILRNLNTTRQKVFLFDVFRGDFIARINNNNNTFPNGERPQQFPHHRRESMKKQNVPSVYDRKL